MNKQYLCLLMITALKREVITECFTIIRVHCLLSYTCFLIYESNLVFLSLFFACDGGKGSFNFDRLHKDKHTSNEETSTVQVGSFGLSINSTAFAKDTIIMKIIAIIIFL